MAKNGGGRTNTPYTSIAKSTPTNGPTRAGCDTWWVVGGQPGNQSTDKRGPGQMKNTGKIVDR